MSVFHYTETIPQKVEFQKTLSLNKMSFYVSFIILLHVG